MILFIVSEVMFFFFIFLDFFSFKFSSYNSNRKYLASFRNTSFENFSCSCFKHINFNFIWSRCNLGALCYNNSKKRSSNFWFYCDINFSIIIYSVSIWWIFEIQILYNWWYLWVCFFFLITGFHGIHVIVGSIFLFVCFYRYFRYHFTAKHHLGFQAAAWYWHFVDVVWILLFFSVYMWGNYYDVLEIENNCTTASPIYPVDSEALNVKRTFIKDQLMKVRIKAWWLWIFLTILLI